MIIATINSKSPISLLAKDFASLFIKESLSLSATSSKASLMSKS